MISKKEIEKMNIAFDFSRQYTIARVPKVYRNAEQFALEVVYSLRPTYQTNWELTTER